MQVPTGEILFIGMVPFQDGKTLQLDIGFGEGQDCGVAGGDSLDLGIGELVAADVFGATNGVVAGDYLAVMCSNT